MRPQRPLAFALTLPLLCGLCLGPTFAQSAAPPPPTAPPHTKPVKKKKAPRSATSRSPNVKKGEIVTLDAANATLTFKDSLGQAAAYGFGEKTRWFKAKHAAQPADFKAGDVAVAHLRRSRADGSLTLTEVTDPASWDWLSALRRETTSAVISSLAEDALTATVGTDATPFTYTVSEKTRWSKAGKEATPGDFKAGETVFVVPRSLPSGAIMARIVADTPIAAALEKERTARTVHGTVRSVDNAAHTFTLATVAGDTRTLRFDATTELRQGTKTLPLTTLKPGLLAGARLRPDKDGDEAFAWRILVETGRGRKAARKRSSGNPVRRKLPDRPIPGKRS